MSSEKNKKTERSLKKTLFNGYLIKGKLKCYKKIVS